MDSFTLCFASNWFLSDFREECSISCSFFSFFCFLTQSVNNYMRALSHCGNWMAALELFTAVHKDPQVVQQAQALKSGLIALSSALQKAAASSGMLNVVHFMMVHHIKVRTLLYFHFFNTFFLSNPALEPRQSIFTWHQGSHTGVQKHRNDGYVVVPNKSCVRVELFSHVNASFWSYDLHRCWPLKRKCSLTKYK